MSHRVITEHHDGLGLNDLIEIKADLHDPNAGGASHRYRYTFGMHGVVVGYVQFQHGPRNEEGSQPGITEAALIVVLLDRLRAFQSGPFACRENAIMITKIEEALMWTERRARERAKRGVLGKNKA